MQKVFKVLRKEHGKLVSANIHVTQEYFLGEVNLPKFKGSKIFVFKSFEDAVKFCEGELTYYCNSRDLVVYEALADGVEKIEVILDISSYKHKDKTIEEKWLGSFCLAWTRKAPKNTLVCSSLYLLKKVDDRKLYGYKKKLT